MRATKGITRSPTSSPAARPSRNNPSGSTRSR
jgi:hypothetical protein